MLVRARAGALEQLRRLRVVERVQAQGGHAVGAVELVDLRADLVVRAQVVHEDLEAPRVLTESGFVDAARDRADPFEQVVVRLGPCRISGIR